ncbi:unnamed protein product [Vitrella brassicaformis CCMP3155]|uniref:Uncharacterized protein n=1 Tax=Vitrella brassicaformis (strain CCMP3155) TaxID=1169540 RepID=A0A0G4FF85_VITBC|nr:unnamed protein product [Vitrella brassicaformis CCMP3155]|eukprot:CEM11860.1 unnamed protein product [Vitrella brassicaformis CCMP3155]
MASTYTAVTRRREKETAQQMEGDKGRQQRLLEDLERDKQIQRQAAARAAPMGGKGVVASEAFRKKAARVGRMGTGQLLDFLGETSRAKVADPVVWERIIEHIGLHHRQQGIATTEGERPTVGEEAEAEEEIEGEEPSAQRFALSVDVEDGFVGQLRQLSHEQFISMLEALNSTTAFVAMDPRLSALISKAFCERPFEHSDLRHLSNVVCFVPLRQDACRREMMQYLGQLFRKGRYRKRLMDDQLYVKTAIALLPCLNSHLLSAFLRTVGPSSYPSAVMAMGGDDLRLILRALSTFKVRDGSLVSAVAHAVSVQPQRFGSPVNLTGLATDFLDCRLMEPGVPSPIDQLLAEIRRQAPSYNLQDLTIVAGGLARAPWGGLSEKHGLRLTVDTLRGRCRDLIGTGEDEAKPNDQLLALLSSFAAFEWIPDGATPLPTSADLPVTPCYKSTRGEQTLTDTLAQAAKKALLSPPSEQGEGSAEDRSAAFMALSATLQTALHSSSQTISALVDELRPFLSSQAGQAYEEASFKTLLEHCSHTLLSATAEYVGRATRDPSSAASSYHAALNGAAETLRVVRLFLSVPLARQTFDVAVSSFRALAVASHCTTSIQPHLEDHQEAKKRLDGLRQQADDTTAALDKALSSLLTSPDVAVEVTPGDLTALASLPCPTTFAVVVRRLQKDLIPQLTLSEAPLFVRLFALAQLGHMPLSLPATAPITVGGDEVVETSPPAATATAPAGESFTSHFGPAKGASSEAPAAARQAISGGGPRGTLEGFESLSRRKLATGAPSLLEERPLTREEEIASLEWMEGLLDDAQPSLSTHPFGHGVRLYDELMIHAGHNGTEPDSPLPEDTVDRDEARRRLRSLACFVTLHADPMHTGQPSQGAVDHLTESIKTQQAKKQLEGKTAGEQAERGEGDPPSVRAVMPSAGRDEAGPSVTARHVPWDLLKKRRPSVRLQE